MGSVDPDLVVQGVIAELDTGYNDAEGVYVKGYEYKGVRIVRNSTVVEEIDHGVVEDNVVDDSKVDNADDVCQEETEILCSDDCFSDGEEEECSRMVVDDAKDAADMNAHVAGNAAVKEIGGATVDREVKRGVGKEFAVSEDDDVDEDNCDEEEEYVPSQQNDENEADKEVGVNAEDVDKFPQFCSSGRSISRF